MTDLVKILSVTLTPMIHTCGTSMTNFIFCHALAKENVDWLPRYVNGGFLLADAVSEWGRGGGGHGMKGS